MYVCQMLISIIEKNEAVKEYGGYFQWSGPREPHGSRWHFSRDLKNLRGKTVGTGICQKSLIRKREEQMQKVP